MGTFIYVPMVTSPHESVFIQDEDPTGIVNTHTHTHTHTQHPII